MEICLPCLAKKKNDEAYLNIIQEAKDYAFVNSTPILYILKTIPTNQYIFVEQGDFRLDDNVNYMRVETIML